MKGNSTESHSPRRQIAYVGAWNTLQLDLRNPYTVAFWSMAYAGMGHLLLDRYFRGFVLLIGELILNAASHLNMAIFYTITKQFDQARQILDTRWMTLYIAVYCFAIWDSYREAVEINNTYNLAAREDAGVKCFAINSASFTHLSSAAPWMAMIWSAVMPGAGCFMLQKMNRAIILMALWTVNAYLARFYPALIHSLTGHFDLARSSLDIHWFLNIPSIWFFSIYEAYSCAIENNKLYRRELTGFLKREYQSKLFPMPETVRKE